jgi:hypothetical protein
MPLELAVVPVCKYPTSWGVEQQEGAAAACVCACVRVRVCACLRDCVCMSA